MKSSCWSTDRSQPAVRMQICLLRAKIIGALSRRRRCHQLRELSRKRIDHKMRDQVFRIIHEVIVEPYLVIDEIITAAQVRGEGPFNRMSLIMRIEEIGRAS